MRRAISARSFWRMLGRRLASVTAQSFPWRRSSTDATGRRRPSISRVTARSTKCAYLGSVWIWTRRSEPGWETLRLCGNDSTVKRLVQHGLDAGKLIGRYHQIEIETDHWLDVGVDR